MADLTVEQVVEALKANPTWSAQVVPVIAESDALKGIVNNKADALYKQNIDAEVSKLHTMYDDDMFNVLGERAGTDKDGNKQKTYVKAKALFDELKTLRETKDSLTKDAEVQRLNAEVEKLKQGGGAQAVQEIFDQAKTDWAKEKDELQAKIDNSATENENFRKSSSIDTAIAGIKLNPDISESVSKMILDGAKSELLKNSKLEDGKLVFLDAEGKPILNKTDYTPLDANGVLQGMKAVQDISLKANDDKGGGADRIINGKIETTKVEGKDKKSLVLQEGSFKSRTEFVKVAEQALLDSGVARSDQDWDTLKNQAYADYEVSKLPATI